MAIVKLGTTKVANRLVNYCDKKAMERDYNNVIDPETVREQMKGTREAWEKSDGIQAHHVIQSFKPDEITVDKANEIGRELAEKIAPGYEAAIYTHADRKHIHNHIVINSVSFENGRKLHLNKADYFKVRDLSDNLCREHGLSVIERPFAKERFSMAEYKLAERGESLWKDELRTAIDEAKLKTSSIDEMKAHLKQTYNIEMKIQNKNVSFLHPEKQKFCRGSKLGEAYTRGEIENEFNGKPRESEVKSNQRNGEPAREFGSGKTSSESGQQSEHNGRKLQGTDGKLSEFARGTHESGKDPRSTHHKVNKRNGQVISADAETPERTNPGINESSTRNSKLKKGSNKWLLRTQPGSETKFERTITQTGNRELGERFGGNDNLSGVPSSLKVIKEITRQLQIEAEKQKHQKTKEPDKINYIRDRDDDRER